MSMFTGARTWVDLPAPEPLGGGIISVARVIDTSGHELMGIEAESDACATAEEWVQQCPPDKIANPNAVGGVKLFDSAPEFMEGDPFTIYTGVSCDLQRLDEAKARAERRLAYAEARAVDFHIDAQLAADTDVIDLGGPFSLPEAIGHAEAFAATYYGGRPTLLIPRSVIPCGGCCQFESTPGGLLSTISGSRVAPLTIPVPIPAVSGPVTMYVTGQIVLLRGPVLSVSVPQQIIGLGPTFAPMRALAERIYVPIFDCLVAKVEVTCS